MEANTYTLEQSPLLAALRPPISEANPCGVDISWDEEFRRIKAEINKSNSVGGIDHEKMAGGGSGSASVVGGVDYTMIVETCRALLVEKSKDLRVASYLAVGLYHTQGIAGFVEGLAVLHGLSEAYWETLFPAKVRARKGAFKLLVDRLADELDAYDPTADDREPLEQSVAYIERLQGFLMEAMQDDAPAMSGLKAKLSELLRRVPNPFMSEPIPEPTPKAEPASAVSQAPVQQATVSATVTAPPVGAVSNLADAKRAIGESAAIFLANDGTDPMPYRLSRVLRWDVLQEEPTHEHGETPIEAPPEVRCDFLKGMLAKGQYAQLVAATEEAFQEHPFHFWLDLQRLLVTAMDALGDPFAQAREALLQETARLVRRLPTLPSLTFIDGVPFADLLTRDWITSSVLPAVAAGGGSAGSPQGAANNRAPVDEQYTEAKQRLGRGNLSDALEVMQGGAAQDGSQKERFRRRLYLASLCFNGGKPALARPLLERLDQEVERHALDVWDPALALEVWSKLYACYGALTSTTDEPRPPKFEERAERVFEKLCALDTRHALSFAGSA